MGEGHSHHGLAYDNLAVHHHDHHHQQQLQPSQPPPRYGCVRDATVGEIVEVQGGHIMRSTGRKDRHSKVCTAKGPRDRRVRLSAHTAIQFYDVQDRLGYDRPSKAVDWLIKNAKAAIDELAELPPWTPSGPAVAAPHTGSASRPPPPSSDQSPPTEQAMGESSNKPIAIAAGPVVSAAFSFGSGGGGNENTSFLPLSLDSDSIAATIRSFFPLAAAATATPSSSSPSIGFQTFLPDLPSRTSNQAQDLRLSLQSFQDPAFHNPESGHHHHHHSQYHQTPTPTHNAPFLGSASSAFDAASASAGWAEQSQRIVPWNVVESGGGGGGYMFSFPPPPQAVSLHSVLGQSQLFSQRGPLQSSNSPVVRAWADPVDDSADNPMQPPLHPSMPSIGFASGAGFSGFRIPARIQGEEEYVGITDKPPAASSASHH